LEKEKFSSGWSSGYWKENGQGYLSAGSSRSFLRYLDAYNSGNLVDEVPKTVRQRKVRLVGWIDAGEKHYWIAAPSKNDGDHQCLCLSHWARVSLAGTDDEEVLTRTPPVECFSEKREFGDIIDNIKLETALPCSSPNATPAPSTAAI
jgi:hypothetical protein